MSHFRTIVVAFWVTLTAVLLVSVIASKSGAQPTPSGFIEAGMQFVPATNTDIIIAPAPLGVRLQRITLSNTSASSVTCNVRDRSTNCGGAACQFWPNITLDANSLQSMDFNGAISVGGVAWSCSTGGVVVGSILGRQ